MTSKTRDRLPIACFPMCYTFLTRWRKRARTALFVLALAPIPLSAETYWRAGTGSWFDGPNWTSGVPDSRDYAYIGNGGTALIGSPGAEVFFLVLGWTDGVPGHLSVSGAGSLNIGVIIYVGSDAALGPSSFDITGGGKVFSHDGMAVGPNSSVHIDGAGSEFNEVFGSLIAKGSITVTNGGLLSSPNSYNALYGPASISDAGSIWRSRNLIVLNTFEAIEGAVVSTYEGSVGALGTSNTAVATLDGSTSAWSNETDIKIGANGRIDILQGATLSTATARLGKEFYGQSVGFVQVTGEGSTWTSSSELWVGSATPGSALGVSEGGKIFVGTGPETSSPINVTNGGTLGGTGNVTGDVTLWAGGTVSPGAGPIQDSRDTPAPIAALSFLNNVTFSGLSGNSATYRVNLNEGDNNSDRLVISGSLDLSSPNDRIEFFGATDDESTYVLATYSAVNGMFDDFSTVPANYSLVYGATELVLTPFSCGPDSDGDGQPDYRDCAPNNPSIHRGAPEVCNGVDDNCNGLVDEGLRETLYLDGDGDGYGNSAVRIHDCSAPPGYANQGGDCDDNDPAVYPGAPTPPYSGVPNEAMQFTPSYVYPYYDPISYGWTFTPNKNLTVTTLGYFDAEGDGLVESHEVGIFDSAGILLGSTTVPAGSAGTLEAGYRYTNLTTPIVLSAGQSYTIAAFSAGPADPIAYPNSYPPGCSGLGSSSDIAIPPGAARSNYYQEDTQLRFPEYPTGDDISGGPNFQADIAPPGCVAGCESDYDGDGEPDAVDCDPFDPSIHPGALEVCNGFDDNCDGNIDEGTSTLSYQDADGDGWGNPSESSQSCPAPEGYVSRVGDCDDNDPAINPCAGTCAAPLSLNAVVSQKMHGGLGPFAIDLPLTGAAGTECRSSGGVHTFVFTFTNDVVSGDANITSGAGVAESPTFAGNTMTVSLSGVADAQTITVTLSNVTDSFAQVLPDTTVSVNMLIGDTTGNTIVNSSDIAQTKGQSGVLVSEANCRQDVTIDGAINSSDIALVKSRSGTGISASPQQADQKNLRKAR